MAQVESEHGVPNGGRGSEPPPPSASPASPEAAEADPEVANMKMVAPTLRVEVLREEEGHSSSSYLSVSEEEGGLSQGEASDQDQGGKVGADAAASKEFVPPNDELKQEIVDQVEFYFSDVNILKDAFLLKHVRRNKQGFVSLKLITSFRKVKKMTKDYRVVAYSLHQSEQLELNEEGSKVRRKAPLPDYDETTPSRTVVAVNLPIENPTVETVAELFTKAGDIALVRILKPGKPLPPDVKRHVNKHPELGNAVCAVIEFEHHDAARKACDDMTNAEDWRKGLRVVLLAHQKKDKKEKSAADKGAKNNVCNGPAPGDDTSVDANTNKGSEDQDVKNDATKEVVTPTKSAQQSLAPGSQQPDEETSREGRRQRKKRGGRKGRVTELVKGEVGSPVPSSGSEPEGSDMPSWRTHTRRDSGGRSSLSPNPEPNGCDIEGADSASWRSRRRGSGGSFSGRASLSPHADPNRLSPCTTPRTTPRSSPLSSPRSSPRGSPASRRRLLGKSPLAADGLSPGTSPKPSPCGSPETRRKNSADETGSSPSSPWVQRRLKAQQELGGSPLPGSSPGASPRLGRHMEGVTRQPYGPDGTKGFIEGIGRGKARSETM